MISPRKKWEIVSGIQRADSLKVKRQRFAENFGFTADSKAVDAAIIDLLSKAEGHQLDGQINASITISVPIELVLALTLRQGFGRGRGRLRKSTFRSRKLLLAIKTAENLRKEHLARGMPKGAARERAVREAADQFGIEPSIIRDQMGRSEK